MRPIGNPRSRSAESISSTGRFVDGSTGSSHRRRGSLLAVFTAGWRVAADFFRGCLVSPEQRANQTPRGGRFAFAREPLISPVLRRAPLHRSLRPYIGLRSGGT